MIKAQYVVEVLPDRRSTEGAVQELVAKDLSDASLLDALDRASHHVVDVDPDVTFGRAVAIGMLVGVPLGGLVSIGLVALAATVTDVDVTSGLVGGAAAGVLLGLFFGGIFGVAASNRAGEAIELLSEIVATGDEVVVAVRPDGHEADVREVLERHGGHPVHAHFELD